MVSLLIDNNMQWFLVEFFYLSVPKHN